MRSFRVVGRSIRISLCYMLMTRCRAI